MKVLFLGGVFASENEDEIMSHAKTIVQHSANQFQEKLITGFRQLGCDFEVLSAPFIGAFPINSDVIFFRGFENYQNQYEYVNFCNIWGIRNFSRATALKQALGRFIADSTDGKMIMVYSPHTPFLEAAVYAKKCDPTIKICLVVPDLPQYMNLNAKISYIYKLGKQYDIAKFNKLSKWVDSFVLLTEPMAEVLNVGKRPYIVVEGIVEKDVFEINAIRKSKLEKNQNLKYIVYTGKLNERFGVKKLVDAFLLMDNPEYRLVLCGRGELEPYIEEKRSKDARILYLGQVTHDTANDWALKADVLVNPRPNNEDYTKYSFPSKNIEFLATGNTVVAYMLDGMPHQYRNFIVEVENDSVEALKDAIQRAVEQCEYRLKFSTFQEYAVKNLNAVNIAERITDLFKQ